MKKVDPQPEFYTDTASLGKFRAATAEANTFTIFFNQLSIMLKRNLLLQYRNWQTTLSQTVLAPLIFHLLLFILQQADYARQRTSNLDPTASTLNGLVGCQGRNPGEPCIDIMYTPAIEPYTSIMASFASLNVGRDGDELNMDTDFPQAIAAPTKSFGIVPVPDSKFIYDYAVAFPNVTRWGISFSQPTEEAPINIQYQLWFNSTASSNLTDIFGREVLSFMRGLDESIITVLHDNDNPGRASLPHNIKVEMQDWPVVPVSDVSDSVVQRLGAVFFFCSQMVIFISVLSSIVAEKEMKLRIALEMMGLKPSAFWASNFLSYGLLVFGNAFVSTVLGVAFQFEAFLNCNFFVMLFLFFLFGMAMVSLAFLLTTFVRKTQVAILSGIFVFVIGLLFVSFVFGNSFLGYIWWENVKQIPETGWQVLIFVPFFNFGRMFLDITSRTTGRRDPLTRTFIAGPGFPWAALYEDIPLQYLPTFDGLQPVVPVSVSSFYYLLMDIVVFYVLTIYFDQTIANEYGVKRNPIFFLFPSYWGFGVKKSDQENATWLKNIKAKSGGIVVDGQDEAVIEEQEKATSDTFWPAVKLVNIRKVFQQSRFYKKATDKIAVKDASLTFEEGKLLALLGQNGAGKSTTMNILSGLTKATKGDALIYGYSVDTQMSTINKIMGVCPQHDVLFDELTAVEHIEIYAGLKGVPRIHWPRLIEDRLKCVRLWTVRNARSNTYSGGMKRRLSLIIATIGDPKVMFLDEPTTGMDPVNRRHVWSFIENFKEGRVIVLTTHSMEEADVLGDRITVMAHGAIRAIGNSITLKNKYGAGYRINIITEESKSESVKTEVLARVPGAVLEDESAGALIFQFPNESKGDIPEFVEWLEGGKGDGVKTWGISQATLEEVFLKIIRDANPDGYSGYEAMKK